jgi:hypothetical protein
MMIYEKGRFFRGPALSMFLILFALTPSDSPAGLWAPDDIATVAWFDASDTNTIHTNDVAGRVSQWDDKSGNSYNLTNSNPTNQPMTGITSNNGLNTLYFDTTKLYNTGSFISSQPFSVAVVVSRAVASQKRSPRLISPTSGAGLWIDAAEYSRYWNFGTITTSYSPTNNEFLILSGLANGASSEIRVNGGDADTGDTGTAAFSGGLCVGERPDVVFDYYSLQGSIGEIIISGEAWDTDTRQKVEGYLAHKWGSQTKLPNGHPYKEHPPGWTPPGMVISFR